VPHIQVLRIKLLGICCRNW